MDKKINSIVSINNQGYAQMSISNNIMVKNIRDFAKSHKLPILNRKWDKIAK